MDLKNTNIPPSAIDIEDAVIASMISYKSGSDEVLSVFQDGDVFYKPANKLIFEAAKQLYELGLPIDLLTVSQKCRSLGILDSIGGDSYLISLTQKISSSAHTEYHSRILLQQFLKRKIILFTAQISALAYDETTDVFELIDNFQKLFDKIVDYTSSGRITKTFAEGLEILKKQIQFLSENNDDIKLVGIDTGFKRTNRKTGGYRNQDFIVLGARPGQGKTAKALKTVIANVKKLDPVGFISGEMSSEQLIARCVAIDTNFHLNQLMNIGFVKPEYFQTLQFHIERMKKYPLIIDDTGNMDISDVVILAKQWHRKFGIKFLVIDYIQLMKDRSYRGSQRSDELAGISRRLKMLAKELNIPVLALAQVNRDCEKRSHNNKRPQVSDIKDCGAIEQDADIIEFIYRPEVYKLELDPEDYSDAVAALIPLGANAEVIFAKYRGGSTGPTLLKWVGDKTKFVDVEDVTDTVDYVDIEQSIELPKINPADAFGEDKDDLAF